jgi:hypothetical protein
VAHGPLQLPGLVAQLVEIGVLGERGGRHRSLLSRAGRSATPVERRVRTVTP